MSDEGTFQSAEDGGPAKSDRTDDAPACPPPAKVPRFRPGFAWGLAAGMLAVVIIIGAGAAVSAYLTLNSFRRLPGRGGAGVVVSPVTAGKKWFSVSADGTGTMQAWAVGDSGSGDGPAGSVAEFTVGVIDSVDGVTIKHEVRVYLTAKTKILVGGVAYGKGKAASPAEAIFDFEGNGSDILTNALLTIEFHREGTDIVADRISEPLEGATNPLMQ